MTGKVREGMSRPFHVALRVPLAALGLFVGASCQIDGQQFREIRDPADAEVSVAPGITLPSPDGETDAPVPNTDPPALSAAPSPHKPALDNFQGENDVARRLSDSNRPTVALPPTDVAEASRPTSDSAAPSQHGTTWQPGTPGLAGPDSELRAMQFNRVEPGVTLLDEVRALWGDPLKELQAGSRTVMPYKVAGFRQVDIITREEKVDAILIHLNSPIPVAHVELELGLQGLRPVLIPDNVGNVLGQAYPERGVLLHRAVEGDKEAAISEIMLEPVTGELFRLRAEHDFGWLYEQDEADLATTLQIDPGDARAHWLLACRFQRAGRLRVALSHIDEAIKRHPTNATYQVVKATILVDQGNIDDARTMLSSNLNRETVDALEKAEANLALGDLIGLGPEPDYQAALEHHLAAIQLAVESSGSEYFRSRRRAKRILVHAHLGAARDIAGGYFQRQAEVVPRWLERADKLAREFIERDQGDPSLQIATYRAMLDAYALLPDAFEPTIAIEQCLHEGRQLIADNPDPSFQRQVEWQMTQALFQAGEIARARGDASAALRYATSSLALLENVRVNRDASPAERTFEGQLYFLIGAVHAVDRQDHDEASRWFDKSEGLLRDTISPSRYANHGLRGERFVSMGVSFWQTQQQQRAVDVTLHGISLIEQAIANGTLTSESLGVPYGNLATMHQGLGNRMVAQRYAEMMAKVERADTGLK